MDGQSARYAAIEIFRALDFPIDAVLTAYRADFARRGIAFNNYVFRVPVDATGYINQIDQIFLLAPPQNALPVEFRSASDVSGESGE